MGYLRDPWNSYGLSLGWKYHTGPPQYAACWVNSLPSDKMALTSQIPVHRNTWKLFFSPSFNRAKPLCFDPCPHCPTPLPTPSLLLGSWKVPVLLTITDTFFNSSLKPSWEGHGCWAGFSEDGNTQGLSQKQAPRSEMGLLTSWSGIIVLRSRL